MPAVVAEPWEGRPPACGTCSLEGQPPLNLRRHQGSGGLMGHRAWPPYMVTEPALGAGGAQGCNTLPLPQVLTELKSDNQRLKDENGALIRVISKLSK